MADIETARQQVQQARQNLAEQRKQAEETRQRLKKQEEALPEIRSARALRQNQFSGLQGRTKRRQVREAEKTISRGLGDIREVEANLTKYEEEQIKPVEAQIREYDLRKAALEQATKLYYDKVPIGFISGKDFSNPYTYGYLKDLYKQKRASELANAKIGALADKFNTGGIEALSPKEQNLLSNLEKSGMIQFKNLQDTLIDSSRTEKVKTFANFADVPMPKQFQDRTFFGKLIRSAPSFIERPAVAFSSAVYTGVTRGGEALSNVPFGRTTLGGAGVTALDVSEKGLEKFGGTKVGATIGEGFGKVLDVADFASKGIKSYSEAELNIKSNLADTLERTKGGSVVSNVLDIRPSTSEQILRTKVLPAVVRESPRIVGYGLAPEVTLVGEAAYTGTKYRDLDKTANEILDKEWKEYSRSYVPQEGYEKLTKEQFEAQVLPEIKRQLKQGLRVETATILGFAALGAGSTIAKTERFFKPQLIKDSLKGGNIFKVNPTITQIPVETKEGIKSFSFFRQMVVKTPKTGLYNSQFRNLFRLEPKLKVIEKGQTYIGEPVKNILRRGVNLNEPYLYRYGRVGKGGDIVNQKFFKIYQEGKQVSPEELKFLSKAERLEFEKLAESNIGKPVSGENVGKFFKEDAKLSKGSSINVDISKIGTGRAKSFSTSATELKGIKVSESGDFGTFKFKTAMRNFDRRLTRGGKTNIQEGLLIKYPRVSREGTDITSFRGRGKGTKPTEEIVKLEAPEQVVLPEIKPRKTTPISTQVKQSQYPSMVGGQGLDIVPFSGRGTYERAISGGVSTINKENVNINIVPPKILNIQTEQVKVESKARQIDVLKPSTKESYKIDLTIREIQKPMLMERTKTEQRERLKTNQILKQETVLDLSNTSVTERTPRKPKTPKTPKNPKIPLLQSLATKAERGDLFEAFAFTKGKEKKVSEGTLTTSAKGLKSFLTKELSASGFLVEKRTGKKVSAKEVLDLFGSEFRVGKSDAFKIVEKKQKRLRKGGTGKEIQFFRNTGSKSVGGLLRI